MMGVEIKPSALLSLHSLTPPPSDGAWKIYVRWPTW